MATRERREGPQPVPPRDPAVEAVRKLSGEALEQRRHAIGLANAQRQKVALMRVALHERKIDGYALLRGDVGEWESTVAKLTLSKVLPMVRGVARNRAHNIIEAFGATPSTRLGALTWARRAELASITRGAVEIDV